MESFAENQWCKLLEGRISHFEQQRCENIRKVCDETTLRLNFEKICASNHEPDRTTLLAKLQASFRNVESFRIILNGTRLEMGMLNPSQFLWGGCFAVVEAGYTSFGKEHKDPDSLEGLVDRMCQLHESVPTFATLDISSTSDQSVQRPLQEIFACLIDTYLWMISYLRGMPLAGIYDFSPQISSSEYIQGSANTMAISKALLDIATNKTNKERDHSTGPLSKESSMPALLDYTNQHPSDTRARWTHIKYLGHGGQGDVSKVQEISSGKQFARKAMRFTVWEDPVRDDEERERREAIVREEVSIMQKLRHVHVATVLFTMRERESFDFIMLPVADKDLSSFMKDCTTKHYLATKRNLLPRWMGCLMNALAFAHEQSIRHKDIKPSNILVKGDHVFLTDFGLAVDFADADVSYTTNSFRGTLHYKAPESRTGNVHGRAADIFGLGCVFSEMLTVYGMKAVVDFDKQRQGPTYSEANAFHLNLPEVKSWVLGLRSDAVSNFLVEMILNMLQEDPLLRSKAGELRASFEKEERLCCDLCRMARP